MKKIVRSVSCLGRTILVTGALLATLSAYGGAVVSAQTPAPPGGRRQARNECNDPNLSSANCPFLARYIIPIINALSGAVGVVVVIMVAWGGLQYSSSKDNPQQAAAAKEHIRNALLALVIYIFMIAFLNWIVPGGVF